MRDKRKKTRQSVKGEDDSEKSRVQIVIFQELSYYTGIKDNVLFFI